MEKDDTYGLSRQAMWSWRYAMFCKRAWHNSMTFIRMSHVYRAKKLGQFVFFWIFGTIIYTVEAKDPLD